MSAAPDPIDQLAGELGAEDAVRWLRAEGFLNVAGIQLTKAKAKVGADVDMEAAISAVRAVKVIVHKKTCASCRLGISHREFK